MIAREKDGFMRQECYEPNCNSVSFELIVNLQRPVLQCTKCGRKHVLIDRHTQLMVAHDLVLSESTEHYKVFCPVCKGRGFKHNSSEKCLECNGSGYLDLESKAKREEKKAKRRQKMIDKDLNPDK